MEANLPQSVHAGVRRLLFAAAFVLLLLSAVGYVYWKGHPAVAMAASTTPEQTYYKQLVYVVNEMHNQAENYSSLRKQGSLTDARIEKGRAYVKALMKPLAAPPEELSVAQYIADKLYASYQRYLNDLEADAASLPDSFGQTEADYTLFRQNADLIKLLSSYSGVNVDCH